jgi:hypothetical protein
MLISQHFGHSKLTVFVFFYTGGVSFHSLRDLPWNSHFWFKWNENVLLFFATFVTFCDVSAFLIAISSCDQQSIFFFRIKSSPLPMILQIDACICVQQFTTIMSMKLWKKSEKLSIRYRIRSELIFSKISGPVFSKSGNQNRFFNGHVLTSTFLQLETLKFVWAFFWTSAQLKCKFIWKKNFKIKIRKRIRGECIF